MKYGLVGAKLGHSFSPDIHRLIGDYEYKLAEMTGDELDVFLRAKDFCGINVTIPYKETVIPYLDEISEQAKSIGAVNVIVNRRGRLCGFNTDYYGARELIKHIGIDMKGKKVLILGTGGTSKTMTAVARDMGASDIKTVSRSRGDGVITYGDAVSLHRDAQIIINTTPVGMFPDSGGCPIDLAPFEALEGVVDAIFNPLATPLVRSAAKRGIKAEGGLYMLVVQAVYASALFFDKAVDETVVEKVYSAVRRKKQNIVLIGMPSSGKTTVGRMLAKSMGKKMTDTDDEIVRRAGMTVPEIFEKHGEAYFRDLEGRVIADASLEQGIVISTGGGSVLRDENVCALKANGRLYYLDRPLDKLVTTSDRPLSSDREKLKKLYDARKDIYRSAADVVISADGSARSVAELITEEFEK